MRLVRDFVGILPFTILQATFVRHAGGVSLASDICPKIASGGLTELASFTFRSDEAASAALSRLADNIGANVVAVEFLAGEDHPLFADTLAFGAL